MMMTYIQRTTFVLRSHLTPHTLLQTHNSLCAFLNLTSTYSPQVNRESRITCRYLTNPERLSVTPKKCGSKKLRSFLFFVNATSSVLSGLTDSLNLLQHISTVKRAYCMSPDIYPPQEDICHLRTLGYISHSH